MNKYGAKGLTWWRRVCPSNLPSLLTRHPRGLHLWVGVKMTCGFETAAVYEPPTRRSGSCTVDGYPNAPRASSRTSPRFGVGWFPPARTIGGHWWTGLPAFTLSTSVHRGAGLPQLPFERPLQQAPEQALAPAQAGFGGGALFIDGFDALLPLQLLGKWWKHYGQRFDRPSEQVGLA